MGAAADGGASPPPPPPPDVGPPGHAGYAWPGDAPSLVAATRAFNTGTPPNRPNFVRWLDFSPDGGWLAVATDDNCVRLWKAPLEELQRSGNGDTKRLPPPLTLTATWPVGESFYGAAFHPLGGAPGLQDAAPPAVPGFGAPLLALAARSHPPRLVDGATGATIATYVPLNDVFEPAPALAVAFADGGARLLAGVGESVRVFDTSRPGRDIASLSTRATRRGSKCVDTDAAVPGRIACVAAPSDGGPTCAADPHLAAAGATRGGILLLDARAVAPVAVFGGHTGGVTQVAFGPGSRGGTLFSAARRDAALHCWDARALAGPLFTMHRDSAATNQRLSFGFDPTGDTLVTGGTGGVVSAFAVTTTARARARAPASHTGQRQAAPQQSLEWPPTRGRPCWRRGRGSACLVGGARARTKGERTGETTERKGGTTNPPACRPCASPCGDRHTRGRMQSERE